MRVVEWVAVSVSILTSALPADGAPSVELGQKDLGACSCDLSREHCDPHCCCDPDCDADLRAGFDCLPEGRPPKTSHKCYSKELMHTVNSRADISVLEDDLKGLLCVEVDNNAVDGLYHNNDARVPTVRIDELSQSQGLTSFGMAVTATDASTERRSYAVGDALKAHFAMTEDGSILEVDSADDLTDRERGAKEVVVPMVLRVPNAWGRCVVDPGSAVRFMQDVPATPCWYGPVDLEEACEAALNYRKVGAFLLREIHLSAAARCGDTRCQTIKPICPKRTRGIDGRVTVSECSGEENAKGPRAQFVRDDTGCTCFGALHELAYKLKYGYMSEHNLFGLVEAEVEFTLQDIRSEGCKPIKVPQRSSVVFSPIDRKLNTPRSGNPGYRTGMPLLAATCAEYDDNNFACRRFNVEAEGNEFRSPFAEVEGILPNGACALQSDTEATSPVAIRFGEDAIFGCTASFSLPQLRQLCSAGAGAGAGLVSTIQLLPFGRLGGRFTHVALFGNASLTDVNMDDWIEISPYPETEALEFDDESPSQASQSVCRGAVVGVHFEFLYADFGNIKNPQARIIAARAKHRKGDLRFVLADPTSPQPFEFSVAVSFIKAPDGGDAQAFVPPRPQLPLHLPRDLFYPFTLVGESSAAPPEQASFAVVVALLLRQAF